MTAGKGKNEHITTALPNGLTVSTRKVGKVWETMVLDADGEALYTHQEQYKNEAKHHHTFAVIDYCKKGA